MCPVGGILAYFIANIHFQYDLFCDKIEKDCNQPEKLVILSYK